MKKREFISFLLIFISYSCVGFVSATVLNVCSACNYTNIQDAIDNATAGDIINVSAGTYNENVVINKNIDLIGNNAIITASSGNAAINIIDVNGVKIEGFNITTNNIVIGIWVAGSSNSENPSINLEIKNNNIIINGVSTGIYAAHSNPAHSDWLIQENTIDSAGVNLELYDVKDAEVKENTFEGNGNTVSVVYASELSDVNNADFINNIFLGNGDLNALGVTPTFWIESDFINGDADTSVNNVLIKENYFLDWMNYGIRIGEGNPNFGDINNIVINYNNFYSGTGPAISNEVSDKIFDGTYNYWDSCNGPGPVGPGSGAGVSNNVTFTPWLGICIENKTGGDCAIETNNIILSADLNGTEINSIWFSYTINNTNHNKTASYIGGSKYQITIPSNELVGGQNIIWNVYVTDSTGRIYNNSWKTFYIRKSTYLGVLPWPADGLNSWWITEPLFSLSKDSIGGNVYYQWDSNDIFLYTSPFDLDDIPNSPPKESAGILDLNWWTNFGVCGNETKQAQIFKIDLKDPVIKELVPENNSIIYNLKPAISAYLDEIYQSNSGINKSRVIIKIDGIDVTANTDIENANSLDATVSYVPTSDLAEGQHNVTIDVADNSGRNSELTWFFYINTSTPQPNLTVNSPENKIYNTKRVLFDITTTDNVNFEYINYADARPRWGSLCRSCNEYNRTKRLNEGWNNITIRASDEFNQIKEENITLFIDSRKPRIHKILPARNSVVNGSEFYVKYTEENLQNITLFYGIGTENITKYNCSAGKSQECFFKDIDLNNYEQQWIIYYFEVNDVINTESSEETRVFVDTSSPNLTVYSPVTLAANETYGRNVPFNISISEDVLLEYIDNSDSNPRWRRLTSNSDEYGNSREKTKTLSRGFHNITIKAVDEAGNSDIEVISFEIDY